MPTMHIPEGLYAQYADEYGYSEAKDKIKQTLRKNAPRQEQ